MSTTTQTTGTAPETKAKDQGSVLVERIEVGDGAFAGLLTLNRPEAMNPLDVAMVAGLHDGLTELGEDPTVRVVLITGAGQAFCAGGDLKKYIELQSDKERWPQIMETNHRMFAKIRSLPKPVVALVNGVTVAGGLEILVNCDFAYAARSARIGDGHLRYGQMGGAGALAILPHLIGPAKARELVFSGSLLPAEEVHALGLVNRVFDDEELLEGGLAFARLVAQRSPLAEANAKFVINEGLESGYGFRTHMRLELERTTRYVLTSEDSREGLAAFSEKRSPVFTGR
ncbi:enoyl-CoA hydratase/isomerase family protein [Rhodococcus sp. 14C212]|uniref:enoyl-CoA hydratase-related protein n=1 Tax=Rhodococcus sp. 14C212 TaxID=2711209 RepID=UPI0013EB1DAC|nr:enoyl-CoA hydratase/isomerase family protein [Rhodococcus sp. 14C212]